MKRNPRKENLEEKGVSYFSQCEKPILVTSTWIEDLSESGGVEAHVRPFYNLISLQLMVQREQESDKDGGKGEQSSAASGRLSLWFIFHPPLP